MTTKLPVDLLRDAKKLIASPDRWIKGKQEAIRDDGVRCFCLVGALFAVTPDGGFSACSTHLREVIAISPDHGLADWNDGPFRTHAQVMAALDDAIKLAGARI